MPAAGVELAARQTGQPDAPAVVVLHGALGTRDHVLLGSTRLQDAGFRVVAYDARGHGQSSGPPGPEGYTYDLWLADLLAVLDAFEVDRGLFLGASLGAHTALRLAMEDPDRVAGIVAATPSYDPDVHPPAEPVRKADRLAAGLRSGGVEGFIEALEPEPAWGRRAEALRQVLALRMRQHANLDAVADALEAVWRAVPFGPLADLRRVTAPVAVVGSLDDYDADHPYELAARYADVLPASSFACERDGKLPMAWSGGALAAQVLEVAERAGIAPAG